MIAIDLPKVIEIKAKTMTKILIRKKPLIQWFYCSLSKIETAATPAPSIVKKMK